MSLSRNGDASRATEPTSQNGERTKLEEEKQTFTLEDWNADKETEEKTTEPELLCPHGFVQRIFFPQVCTFYICESSASSVEFPRLATQLQLIFMTALTASSRWGVCTT